MSGARTGRVGKRAGLTVPGFLVAADAIVPCHCGASEGEPCRDVEMYDRRGKVLQQAALQPGEVHFARRLRRLLKTAKATAEERERIEHECVAIVLDAIDLGQIPGAAKPAPRKAKEVR